MTKPNSDNSSRQVRRAEERNVAKARATVARANARPGATVSPTGGMVVSIDELTQLIVERDIQISRLKTQIAIQQTQLAELQVAAPEEVSEDTTPEEPQEDPQETPPQGPTDNPPTALPAENEQEGEPDGEREENQS